MIISRLIGGLGNQMFQFAAGYALAKKLELPLRLDVGSLKKYSRHNGYQFNKIFDGEFFTASVLDVVSVLGLRNYRYRFNSVEVNPSYMLKNDSSIFLERSHNFCEEYETISKSCYLSGYWQSDKYFSEFSNEIKEIFRFKDNLDFKNSIILEEISKCTSVGIHVRRGDYLSNPSASLFHGLCPITYYLEAIKIIIAKDIDARFYVFSDDPSFVKESFGHIKGLVIVDINQGKDSYNDMRLLASCKHHIIANSSFSWWGSWLANSPNQIVIAPKIWFAGSKEKIIDIYNQNWILI